MDGVLEKSHGARAAFKNTIAKADGKFQECDPLLHILPPFFRCGFDGLQKKATTCTMFQQLLEFRTSNELSKQKYTVCMSAFPG